VQVAVASFEYFAAAGDAGSARLMQNEIQALSYMAKNDPAVIAGLLLVGSSSVLYVHVQLKMVRAGYKTSFDVLRGPLSAKGLETPRQYLKVRAKEGWSPWPIYLFLPCMLAGIGLLVFGLFRL
jgi:hypothetical protein